MEDELKKLMQEYMKQVNVVCLQLLEGLNLKTKVDFWAYREKHPQMEFEVNNIKFVLHGRGCWAFDNETFLDWDFGYGSRWCGIDPWLLARTLERNKNAHVEYYDGKRIKEQCEQAVLDGEMYQKYDLYYFIIPNNEMFEPEFPKEYDILIVEHYGSKWIVPRNKMVDRFIRKSKKIYSKIDKSLNLYTLTFMLKGKEVYSISYDDIGYPENAIKIMRQILLNTEKAKNIPDI